MNAKILIAAFPGARTRIEKVLKGHELVFADTMAEAIARLDRERFDMVLIGTQFDESRMFDLLRYLQSAAKRHNSTSIVCFRGMISVPASETAVVEGLSLGCRLLGASGFYDFAGYPKDEEGNATVRRILESHFPRRKE